KLFARHSLQKNSGIASTSSSIASRAMTGHGRTGCMRMARGSFRTPTSSKGLKHDEGDIIARDCCWNAGGGLELCPVRGGRGEDKGLCCLPRGGPEEGPSASHERPRESTT